MSIDKQQSEIIILLNNTMLFSGLKRDEIALILNHGEVRIYKKNELIFNDGDEARSLLVLLKGRIKIFKLSYDGKEQILHMINPGEVFGEVPMFFGSTYPANAISLEDSIVFSITKGKILDIFGKKPELAFRMMGVLSMRLRQFVTLIEDITLKDVPSRLATYILYLMERQNTKTNIKIDLAKNQLAAMIGTVPETLSRCFNKLKAFGLIEMRSNLIDILDEEGLRELSSTGRLSSFSSS